MIDIVQIIISIKEFIKVKDYDFQQHYNYLVSPSTATKTEPVTPVSFWEFHAVLLHDCLLSATTVADVGRKAEALRGSN